MPALSFLRAKPPETTGAPIGIIDIGSNSIRLVIYEGPNRIPSILFNEKIMAGLGKGLARTGMLDPQAADRALTALSRFRRLAADMGVRDLRTVATAAVRDAGNGAAFIDRLAAIGLPVELLSGPEEAAFSGHGVIAGIPDAHGIVADLGGGSLELVRVGDGAVGTGVSVPFGVLRINAGKYANVRALDRAVTRALADAGWSGDGAGRPLYLVGGSWRALARLHMNLAAFPLPIVHHYAMPPSEAQRLVRALGQLDPKRIKTVDGISASRLPTLSAAAMLLAVLAQRLYVSSLVVSAYGLREGLLHAGLPPAVRAQDPLIEAARDEGERQGRFPGHGDLLCEWIAPLYDAREPADQKRLRHATCLLADVGWRAHPEFRAERGLDFALHGNWTGIDARGRAMLGQALFTHFGGQGGPEIVARLCTIEDQAAAIRWGLAMRLGQRLSGGVEGPLRTSRLSIDAASLTLTLVGDDAALYGETVERRHKALAAAFGRQPVMRRV